MGKIEGDTATVGIYLIICAKRTWIDIVYVEVETLDETLE